MSPKTSAENGPRPRASTFVGALITTVQTAEQRASEGKNIVSTLVDLLDDYTRPETHIVLPNHQKCVVEIFCQELLR